MALEDISITEKRIRSCFWLMKESPWAATEDDLKVSRCWSSLLSSLPYLNIGGINDRWNFDNICKTRFIDHQIGRRQMVANWLWFMYSSDFWNVWRCSAMEFRRTRKKYRGFWKLHQRSHSTLSIKFFITDLSVSHCEGRNPRFKGLWQTSILWSCVRMILYNLGTDCSID